MLWKMITELNFCSKMVSRRKLSFQKWSQEKISGNIFWKSNFLPVTIFENNFTSGNHFSKQYLVPVTDFHVNFLFRKYDFQEGVDLGNRRNKLELSWAKLSPNLSQVLNCDCTLPSWSLKFKFEVEVWSLKLKFEFEIWSWSLRLKFKAKVEFSFEL